MPSRNIYRPSAASAPARRATNPILALPRVRDTHVLVVSRGPGGRPTTYYTASRLTGRSPTAQRAPPLPLRREEANTSSSSPVLSRQGSSAVLEDPHGRSRRPSARVAAVSRRPRVVVRPTIPLAECSVCFVDFPRPTAVECPAKRHLLCTECAGNMLRAACAADQEARCAFCATPGSPAFSAADLGQPAAAKLPADVLLQYSRLMRRKAVLASGGAVTLCPKRCGFQLEHHIPLFVGRAVQCESRSCDPEPFCARCGVQPYHYHATCEEFEAARHGMDLLVTEATESPSMAIAEWHRIAKSEEALAADDTVRCCPHCAALIHRVSGCDSMACGRDSDSAAGSQRAGCGASFNWSRAPRYTPRIPPRPDDIVDVGRHLGHFCEGGCASGHCIKGTRYLCLNCSHAHSYCRRCFARFHKTHATGEPHVFVAVPSPEVKHKRRRNAQQHVDADGGCCIVC